MDVLRAWLYCYIFLITTIKLIQSISVDILLKLLTEIIPKSTLPLNHHRLSKNESVSIISERCDNYDDSIKSRIGCCYPNDAKLLYNIMIEKKKIIIYLSTENKQRISNEILKLPAIKSLQKQSTSLFNMEVEVRYDTFPNRLCKSVYNGTLHIVGRSSANNVYHAIGDNFAPLVSQVLNDYFLAPEYIHLPRRMLRGGDFDVNHRSHGVGSNNNPAHLQLMDDLMTDSTLGLAEADGHCFNRVVWGYGAHVLYYDTLVTMRRLVADFTHKFIQKVYKLSEPVEFKTGAQHVTASHSHTGHLSQNLTHNVNFNFHGLKIVFFTRGSSGKGRTMQREASLVQALRDHGAHVLFCCDFSKATLQDQLSYAVHADVIMGLHGAAMVHGFFMKQGGMLLELKTLYGFTSGLFHLVMDARQGVLGQVDVREYFIKGGHRPVDTSLINRTLHVLSAMVQLKRNIHRSTSYLPSSSGSSTGGIMDVNPLNHIGTNGKRQVDIAVSSCTTDTNITEMFHFLGPSVDTMVDMCRQTVLYKFRHEILDQSSEDLHCAPCSPFNARK